MKTFVCAIAGILAGIGTGFAGLSAASFITPILVSCLNFPAYEAVGIALFSDVMASALSAAVYRKSGNVNLQSATPLLISVLLFTVLGSILAYSVSVTTSGNSLLSYWAILAALGLGLKFLFHPVQHTPDNPVQWKAKPILIPLCCVFIGLTCGFQGVGGGLLILFTLTNVMDYEFKKAVGTSVFIMTFTALIGGSSHFAINGLPDLGALALCSVFTATFAVLSACVANRINERILGVSIGATLLLSAVTTLLIQLLKA